MEELDLGALRANLERYAEAGIHGLLASAATARTAASTRTSASRCWTRSFATGATARSSWPVPRTTPSGPAERFLAAAADLGADYGLVLAPGYPASR